MECCFAALFIQRDPKKTHVELILLSCRTNGVWEHMSSDRDGDLWVRTPKLSQLACSKPRETLYNENKADSENIHTWTHCWSPTTSMKRTRSFCACGDLRSVPARSSGAASLPNSTPRVAHALLEKSKVATTKGSATFRASNLKWDAESSRFFYPSILGSERSSCETLLAGSYLQISAVLNMALIDWE